MVRLGEKQKQAVACEAGQNFSEAVEEVEAVEHDWAKTKAVGNPGMRTCGSEGGRVGETFMYHQLQVNQGNGGWGAGGGDL